jgi:ferric-dicitrate binding protein FerR (iron transport regulator)
VVLALFATWKLTGKKFRHSTKQNIALYNDQAKHRRIVLPDSTVVWLNTKSSLSYAADFATHREVTLCGEAFFDVKKKQKQNFIVRTEQLSIQVKGTRFNVHAYESGDHNATLEEGNIELTVIGKPDTYAMTPGDQITVTKDAKDIIVKRVDPADYSAWKEEKLIFDNVPLEDIVLKLENRYHVDIVIAGNITGHERLTMTIEHEPLDEVLEMIQLSSRLNCKKENNQIIIYE